jgi:Concanavalin A-like lectin/glucanases superfamily
VKSFLATALISLALIPTAAFGQSEGTFCTAGIHADGFIDFSLLPPAPPAVPAQPSGPYTYTIPVTGISGLTVQVIIPAGPQGLQAYGVQAGQLSLAAPSATVGFVFSKPVYGVSAIALASGRQSGFSIASSAPSPNATLPPVFSNSVETFNLPIQFYAQPLQEVNLISQTGGMPSTYITIGATDFGLPLLTNVRVQSSSAVSTSLVPKNGLQQWLSSDTIGGPLTAATGWPDSSGNGHDATQNVTSNAPGVVAGDGLYCKPAYAFSNNGYFNFNLPIDGWQEMTVFMVAKSLVNPPANYYASDGAGIFWIENANWGNTFVSPYQSSETFRFGTKQVGNQPVYARPATIGQDFAITRAVHNGATDSLYVNGLLALTQGSKSPVLAGTSGAGYIGRGLNNTTYNGEISEILVYNRVLSANEAASVESYLRNKFGTR